MLSHLHLAIIIAVVVLLLLVLYVYMYPAIITELEADYYDYPVYTLTAAYTSGKTAAIANDLEASRTFVTNQTGDGIFYESTPANTSYSLAILVMKCSANDYATAFGTNANITTSTTPYVGVLVQYSPPSATSTLSKYHINPDISATSVAAANWMGVVDLTLLFAIAAKQSSFNMTAIGNYTGTLPTINKTASTNASFATAASVTKWPPTASSASLVSTTASSGGFGITLTTPAISGNVATS